MWRMTIGATDIVAPVFASTEVVMLFLARVTSQTDLGYLLGRHRLERHDFSRIAFLNMRLAWSMTRLTTGNLVLPTAHADELRV